MISLISGSSRANSESRRFADYLSNRVLKLNLAKQTNIISLENSPIPLWSEHASSLSSPDNFLAKSMRILEQAESVVIVAPEWNGSTSPDLRNFLHYCTPKQLAHKPALIVAISSGQGGAYVIAELKSFTNKNNSLVYIPGHIIVRQSPTLCLNEETVSEVNSKLIQRIDHSLKMLAIYSSNMNSIRETNLIDLNRYSYGM
ncbi:NADPH-dependent FMN reductase [Teredinibacter waterburyi]|uniref:NADPH-dependent FMN reductase n=1 Tax=Teredinibacter waterburyi TaxID=1500538 RepID=UPI00165FE138|nr:NAD(P)H-dependent oxidoreductase [Teredinibacter waterburyi]